MIEWQLKMSLNGIEQQIDVSFQAKGLQDAKQCVLQEVRAILPNRRQLYLEAEGAGVYTIVSDLDEIGRVIIKHQKNEHRPTNCQFKTSKSGD